MFSRPLYTFSLIILFISVLFLSLMSGVLKGSEPKNTTKHDIDIIKALDEQDKKKGSEPSGKESSKSGKDKQQPPDKGSEPEKKMPEQKKEPVDADKKQAAEQEYDGRSEAVTDDEVKRFKSYTVSAGIIVNAAAAGLQVEYRFVPPVGVKFMSLYVFALGHEDDQYFPDWGEYMMAFLLGPSFHVPIKGNRFDPHLYFGVLYSHFHWLHNESKKEGDIRDLSFGGGVGLNIRITNYLDIGFNIWADYDYRVRWENKEASKGGRIVLVMPYISVNYLF